MTGPEGLLAPSKTDPSTLRAAGNFLAEVWEMEEGQREGLRQVCGLGHRAVL